MKTTITLTPEELAEIIQAVCQSNGYNAETVAVVGDDGNPLKVHRIDIECTLVDFSVRCVPEKSLADQVDSWRRQSEERLKQAMAAAENSES